MKTKILKYTILSSCLGFGVVHAQNAESGGYEERPTFGVYYEQSSIKKLDGQLTLMNSETNSYRSVLKNVELDPSIGFSGHLPFIPSVFKYWLDASVSASWQKQVFEFDSAGVSRKITSYNVAIEGGPELGIPVYTSEASQQMFKVYSYAHINLQPTFPQKKANFKNGLSSGYSWGLGARYAIDRFNLSAGVKNAEMWWKPSFNSAADGVYGTESQNTLRAHYTQEWVPFLSFEYALY